MGIVDGCGDCVGAMEDRSEGEDVGPFVGNTGAPVGMLLLHVGATVGLKGALEGTADGTEDEVVSFKESEEALAEEAAFLFFFSPTTKPIPNAAPTSSRTTAKNANRIFHFAEGSDTDFCFFVCIEEGEA